MAKTRKKAESSVGELTSRDAPVLAKPKPALRPELLKELLAVAGGPLK